jgi:cation diffusion facilitator CzcD-associated flavoprotein CzcO
MMGEAYRYDVIVIGAGITGMVAAVTVNGLGKRVAVIEKNRVGGTRPPKIDPDTELVFWHNFGSL